MFSRTKAAAALGALACAAIVVPQLASGSPAKTHRINQVIRSAVIEQTATTSVSAGIVTGQGPNTPASVSRGRLTGTTLTGTAVQYGKRGSMTTSFTLEVSPRPDGSVRFSGTWTIVSGSGTLRRATGHGTLTGRTPATSTISRFVRQGTMRY